MACRSYRGGGSRRRAHHRRVIFRNHRRQLKRQVCRPYELAVCTMWNSFGVFISCVNTHCVIFQSCKICYTSYVNTHCVTCICTIRYICFCYHCTPFRVPPTPLGDTPKFALQTNSWPPTGSARHPRWLLYICSRGLVPMI